jgi:hypothetical protein
MHRSSDTALLSLEVWFCVVIARAALLSRSLQNSYWLKASEF